MPSTFKTQVKENLCGYQDWKKTMDFALWQAQCVVVARDPGIDFS
jgi:hypothetical protein